MAPPKEPAHVVIDKDSTARVNVWILVTILAGCVGGALYLRDIENAVDTANTTLREVKVQLATQNGMAMRHNEDLIRVRGRLDHLEKRADALEKAK